ncbi:hypothetical protein B0O41_2460 [Propionibacteriaceae bacterium ES.041]|uniref:hypothetical protein n=1 Tax=Enemella evansiae TaxID=2016499 RepID=UPI000C0061C5|nr:hypothetical protein [Enemella evansiae]PFG67640.1 hypothetical protein B0O41_2460 [Propionibacteriaceae bacterium ES.041]
METMRRENVQRARDYVSDHGRPLEQARLQVVLDGASPSAVTEALTAYWTDAGGFGRALESDCRAPEASALATLTGLDIMRAHRVPADDPLVAAACRWLVEQAETDARGRIVWSFLPPSAQASPHAPWWDQSEPGQLAETFRGFVANPGAAILAHLWRHEAAAPGAIPTELLTRVGEQVRQVVAAGIGPNEVNAHDALAHLVGESASPEPLRAEVEDWLVAVVPERVMRTEADYADYGIHPLWVVPAPDHPLAELLADELQTALDRTIASQQPDGSWKPFWDWGSAQADEWAAVESEWRGTLVVRNIQALKDHGRLP